MKKIIALVICFALCLSFIVPASAASVSVSSTASKTSVVAGETVEIVVSVGSGVVAKKGVVVPTLSSNLEFVSGSFLQSATIARFDTNNNGAIMYDAEKSASGQLCKIVVKAKAASKTTQSVSIRVEFFDGNGASIGSSTTSKNIIAGCATHTFGEYTKADSNNHKRECSACGKVETVAHNWNSGTVTKPASCKETGTKEFTCHTCSATKTEDTPKTNDHKFSEWTQDKDPTCTVAGNKTRKCSVCEKVENAAVAATGHDYGAWKETKAPTCTAKGTETRVCKTCDHNDTRSIAAKGHKFSNPTVTKQPTCTEKGVQSGKCTVCGQTTTSSIAAKGHKFGEWTTAKEATCTEAGSSERKCSVCKKTETKAIEILGHDFENPVVVKEPTISSTGLMEGKCKRCSEATTEEIPCSAKDEETGTAFETEEGVFEEGTEMVVDKVEETAAEYETVKSALKEVSEKFEIFDLSAMLNGATVQPNGKVLATFDIPEGFGPKVAIYYISAEGVYELIKSTIAEDGKTISAELEHFSLYAIVDITEDEISGTDAFAGLDMPMIIIIGAAVLVLIAGVVTVVLVKKRKTA